MTQLREINSISQPSGEPRRRWFESPDMDLMVWYDDGDEPVGFQLSYDRAFSEHSFSWQPGTGYSHMAVDDGENDSVLSYKETPILVPDGHFDARRLCDLFVASSRDLPASITTFIAQKITQHPNYAR